MWAALDRTGHPNLDVRSPMRKVAGQITHLIVATAGPTSSPLGTRRPARGLARSPGGVAVGQTADVLAWASRRGGGLGVAASTLLLVLPPVRATITMLKMVSPMTPGSGSARSGRAGR